MQYILWDLLLNGIKNIANISVFRTHVNHGLFGTVTVANAAHFSTKYIKLAPFLRVKAAGFCYST